MGLHETSIESVMGKIRTSNDKWSVILVPKSAYGEALSEWRCRKTGLALSQEERSFSKMVGK